MCLLKTNRQLWYPEAVLYEVWGEWCPHNVICFIVLFMIVSNVSFVISSIQFFFSFSCVCSDGADRLSIWPDSCLFLVFTQFQKAGLGYQKDSVNSQMRETQLGGGGFYFPQSELNLCISYHGSGVFEPNLLGGRLSLLLLHSCHIWSSSFCFLLVTQLTSNLQFTQIFVTMISVFWVTWKRTRFHKI